MPVQRVWQIVSVRPPGIFEYFLSGHFYILYDDKKSVIYDYFLTRHFYILYDDKKSVIYEYFLTGHFYILYDDEKSRNAVNSLRVRASSATSLPC